MNNQSGEGKNHQEQWKAPDALREEERNRFEKEFRTKLQDAVVQSHEKVLGNKLDKLPWLQGDIKYSILHKIKFFMRPDMFPHRKRLKIGFALATRPRPNYRLAPVKLVEAKNLLGKGSASEHQDEDQEASIQAFLEAVNDHKDAAVDFLEAAINGQIAKIRSAYQIPKSKRKDAFKKFDRDLKAAEKGMGPSAESAIEYLKKVLEHFKSSGKLESQPSNSL